MRNKLMLMGIAIPVIFLLSANKPGTNEKSKPVRAKYNVLYIFVDDLRPELGCYGQTEIKSPNIDALASTGTLFDKQYVSVPTCGASRSSLLSGLRPHSPEELVNEAFEYKEAGKIRKPRPESFVEQMRRNGYYTVGIGKISHSPDGYIYKYLEPRSNQLELPHSWDEMLFNPGKWGTGWNAFFAYSNGNNRNGQKGNVKPYEAGNVDDTGYPDGLTAELAVKKLDELAKRNQPFFLGVGFFKPHLPFNAPKKYWDMYNEGELKLTPSPGIPTNVNPASFHQSGEFNGYKAGDEKASLAAPVSDAYARKLRHAYFAAVSYADAQVGKVLMELKRQGLDKNTVIILWGDHGWHLGDDLVWGKHTLSEWATRSPLIIKMPLQNSSSICHEVVSSIDIYPTLMAMCRLKTPYLMPGKNLLPLLNGRSKQINGVAYSYFNHGITMRTDRYRLTKYFRTQEPLIELYDHQTDPYENSNIAAKKPELVKHLLKQWNKGDTHVFDNINAGSKESEAQ